MGGLDYLLFWPSQAWHGGGMAACCMPISQHSALPPVTNAFLPTFPLTPATTHLPTLLPPAGSPSPNFLPTTYTHHMLSAYCLATCLLPHRPTSALPAPPSLPLPATSPHHCHYLPATCHFLHTTPTHTPTFASPSFWAGMWLVSHCPCTLPACISIVYLSISCLFLWK